MFALEAAIFVLVFQENALAKTTLALGCLAVSQQPLIFERQPLIKTLSALEFQGRVCLELLCP